MKIKHISLYLFLVGSLHGFFASAQGVEADPGPDNGPPPATQPAPQPQQPPPDLMPQQPVEAYPEGQQPEPRYRRPWRRERIEREYPADYEDEARLRLNAMLYYSFAGGAYSSNASVTTNGFAAITGLSADMNSAPGVAAEVFMARPFGWGFDAGLSYDFVRNINDLNTLQSIFYTSPNPTLQFTTIYGNGIFRWWNLYIPLGLNYVIPTFSPGSNNGAIGNSTFTGNVGFQFGLGFLIGRHFSLELEDRILHFQATSTNSNITINWGDTYFSSFLLNLKFNFL